MNNTYFAKVDVTADYQALAEGRTVLTVTLSALPTNSGAVYLRNAAGQEVPLVPGEWHTLVGVNLADLEVKGTVGDGVTLVGGTW